MDSSEEKWGTVLKSDLARRIKRRAEQEQRTQAAFAASAFEAALAESLLDQVARTATVLVASRPDGGSTDRLAPVLGDMPSLALISEFWETQSFNLALSSSKLFDSGQPTPEALANLSRDLVVIGGPALNFVTNRAQLDVYDARYMIEANNLESAPPHEDGSHEVAVTPARDEWHIRSPLGILSADRYADDLMESWSYKNWGVIRFSANPYGDQTDRRLLLLAGLDRVSTLGCVRAACSRRFLNSVRKDLSLNPEDSLPYFECIVYVAIDRGIPVPVEPYPNSVRRLIDKEAGDTGLRQIGTRT